MKQQYTMEERMEETIVVIQQGAANQNDAQESDNKMFDKVAACGEDDYQNELKLFSTVVDKEKESYYDDDDDAPPDNYDYDYGDIALTFEELEAKYGVLTFSE